MAHFSRLLRLIWAANADSTASDAVLDNTSDKDYGYDATAVTVNEAISIENRAKI